MKIHTIQLNIEDFDAGILGMDATEVGAYFCLLMALYKSSTQDLPNDDARLARTARVGTRVWKRIKPILEPHFIINGQVWTNKRVQSEAVKYRTLSQKNTSNRLKGKQTAPPVVNQPSDQTATNISNNKLITNKERKKELKNSFFSFSGLPFAGAVINLDGPAFNLWFQEYSFDGNEDKFRKVLSKRDDWYSIQPYKTQESWLAKTTTWLDKNRRQHGN